jgi:hypothetical protein
MKVLQSAMRRVSVITLSVIVLLVTVFGIAPVVQSMSKSESGLALTAHAASHYTGWKTVDGKKLYFINGKKATGVVVVDENIYLIKKGVSQKGWQTIEKKKFYFKKVAKDKYALTKAKIYSKFCTLKAVDRSGYKYSMKLYFIKTGDLHKGTDENNGIVTDGGRTVEAGRSGRIATD